MNIKHSNRVLKTCKRYRLCNERMRRVLRQRGQIDDLAILGVRKRWPKVRSHGGKEIILLHVHYLLDQDFVDRLATLAATVLIHPTDDDFSVVERLRVKVMIDVPAVFGLHLANQTFGCCPEQKAHLGVDDILGLLSVRSHDQDAAIPILDRFAQSIQHTDSRLTKLTRTQAHK